VLRLDVTIRWRAEQDVEAPGVVGGADHGPSEFLRAPIPSSFVLIPSPVGWGGLGWRTSVRRGCLVRRTF